METLAELALRLRLEAGYTNRSEFAREVGVSSQAILQRAVFFVAHPWGR